SNRRATLSENLELSLSSNPRVLSLSNPGALAVPLSSRLRSPCPSLQPSSQSMSVVLCFYVLSLCRSFRRVPAFTKQSPCSSGVVVGR
ncbi:hypothetical protein VIGAN_11179100, partial [Vigna angularis var. angularis]